LTFRCPPFSATSFRSSSTHRPGGGHTPTMTIRPKNTSARTLVDDVDVDLQTSKFKRCELILLLIWLFIYQQQYAFN